MTVSKTNLQNEIIIFVEQFARLIRDTNHYHNIAFTARDGNWVLRRPKIQINGIPFTADTEELREYKRIR